VDGVVMALAEQRQVLEDRRSSLAARHDVMVVAPRDGRAAAREPAAAVACDKRGSQRCRHVRMGGGGAEDS
jgi:hypothetical protein